MKIRQITEQQVDEAAPIAAAIWIIKFAIRYGAWPVIKWLLKRHGGKIIGGAAAAYYIDQGWDWVVSQIGEKYAQMLIDNKFEIGMAVALILGAVALKRFIEKQGEKLLGQTEESLEEIYKQKDGDYARPGKWPAKKKRGPHPLGGKLVGETATAGSTSAGAMATVINPNVARYKFTKRGKYGAPVAPQKKNKDGTAANALDMSNNIMGGKPIKR